MKKRLCFGLTITSLVIVGILVGVPTARQVVLGWLAGEPFYQFRPLRWWRDEIMSLQPIPIIGGEGPVAYFWIQRQPFGQKWPGCQDRFYGAQLHHGDPAALPVLAALLKDKDPIVRAFATEGLGHLSYEALSTIPSTVLQQLLVDDNLVVRNYTERFRPWLEVMLYEEAKRLPDNPP